MAIRADGEEPGERKARRASLTDDIARIVLADGLSELGLRGLAARLSTSGRMLLYYFGTKEALVVAVLTRISEQMGVIQSAEFSGALLTPGAFLGRVLELARSPEIVPFMRAWTEVVARGARGEAPYDSFAAHTVGEWITWIDSRLLPASRRPGQAAAILAIVDGITLLEMARPGTTIQAQTLLPGLLDGTGPTDGV
ncbi:TetR/AcrR family transcriptional regulator [Lichenicola sp.]|uniref:TetR/AcrR family transcriptional regulator n=1 Tax=Lichenicola sp. TaxID=2804529 RepID=UPI003B000D9C